MALVVFLGGVNVGGHRTFRPSILAKELSDHDVVNVGAAGTFVVRKPGSRAKFRAALLRKLPFEAEVVLCDGRDLIGLETDNPFGSEPSRPDVVRFVSILSRAGRVRASIPVTLPPSGEWLLRVIASKNRFVFGVYRRHKKTIGYLGQIDKLCGVPVTTRNWNTVVAIVRILDRKSTRLNSSHSQISYAVFCLKKKNNVLETRVPWLSAGGTGAIIPRNWSTLTYTVEATKGLHYCVFPASNARSTVADLASACA